MYSIIISWISLSDHVSNVTEAFFKAMAAVRLENFDAMSVVPIASGLAALFIIFRLIKLVNDIEGDNEAGGFGHIKLMDIIRPLIFFTLTINSGFIIKGVDGAMESICTSIGTMTRVENDGLVEYLNNWADEYEKEAKKANPSEDDTNQKWYQKIWKNTLSLLTDAWKTIVNFFKVGFVKFIADIALSVYQVFMVIMVTLSQVNLFILGVMMPFAFALSILDKFKDNYLKVIGYYIEFMMWRPIMMLIMWFMVNCQSVIAPSIEAYIKGMTSNSVVADLTSTFIHVFFGVLMIILCITSLSQVPNLANKALSLGSPAENETHGVSQKMDKILNKIG